MSAATEIESATTDVTELIGSIDDPTAASRLDEILDILSCPGIVGLALMGARLRESTKAPVELTVSGSDSKGATRELIVTTRNHRWSISSRPDVWDPSPDTGGWVAECGSPSCYTCSYRKFSRTLDDAWSWVLDKADRVESGANHNGPPISHDRALAENLGPLRKSVGMTIDALSEATEIPVKLLTRIENGTTSLTTFTHIARIADALGVASEVLVERKAGSDAGV